MRNSTTTTTTTYDSKCLCKCTHTKFYHYMKDNLCTECKRCKGFRYAGKQEVDALALHVKPLLSVAISPEVNKKFRNLVRLRHGVTKGALSFEVERALRQYMGEKDLDVLINDKQWKEVNK